MAAGSDSYCYDHGPLDNISVSVLNYFAMIFFDWSHYKGIQEALSKRWSVLCSITGVLQLLEDCGAKLSPQEKARLLNLEEARQIQSLISRMPENTTEAFDQFLFQLHHIVATASRLREVLDDPESLERILEDAERTGISQYILRMAIVQTGSEVQLLQQEYKQWEQDMSVRLSKVIRGLEDLLTAKRKLAAAQSELRLHQAGHNEKQKKVLMHFLSSSSQGLLTATFKSWRTFCNALSEEARIKEEYKERLDIVQRKLVESKVSNLKTIDNVMKHKAEGLNMSLCREVFTAWKSEFLSNRENEDGIKNLAELEARLSSMQKAQAESAKRVFARMAGDSDAALVSFCLQAWLANYHDFLKEKDVEAAVRAQEMRVQEFLKARGESAKAMLQACAGSSDNGLLSTVMKGWVQLHLEQKREAEMCEKLHGAGSRLSIFGDSLKSSGKGALIRAAYHLDQLALIQCWGEWRSEARLMGVHRRYQRRIDAKRTQFLGVQHMFRNFAAELENGLKGSMPPKVDFWARAPKLKKHGATGRSEGAVTLPDIHQRPGSELLY